MITWYVSFHTFIYAHSKLTHIEVSVILFFKNEVIWTSLSNLSTRTIIPQIFILLLVLIWWTIYSCYQKSQTLLPIVNFSLGIWRENIQVHIYHHFSHEKELRFCPMYTARPPLRLSRELTWSLLYFKEICLPERRSWRLLGRMLKCLLWGAGHSMVKTGYMHGHGEWRC